MRNTRAQAADISTSASRRGACANLAARAQTVSPLTDHTNPAPKSKPLPRHAARAPGAPPPRRRSHRGNASTSCDYRAAPQRFGHSLEVYRARPWKTSDALSRFPTAQFAAHDAQSNTHRGCAPKRSTAAQNPKSASVLTRAARQTKIAHVEKVPPHQLVPLRRRTVRTR